MTPKEHWSRLTRKEKRLAQDAERRLLEMDRAPRPSWAGPWVSGVSYGWVGNVLSSGGGLYGATPPSVFLPASSQSAQIPTLGEGLFPNGKP